MAPSLAVSSGARPWLQLLRPANVVTALADVLAGYAVAGLSPSTPLAWLLVATACLYAGGVVLNDVFDRRIDAVERPERPIPSQRISVRTAARAGAGLLVAGVAAAALAGQTAMFMALAIAAAVLTYDSWGKHRPFLGPLNMGLCRALNLMLGVAAAPAALLEAWPLGLLPLTYIAGVTIVSRGEVYGAKRPVVLLGFVLVAGVVLALVSLAVVVNPGPNMIGALIFASILAWRVCPALLAAVRTPNSETIRTAVGTGVLSLVFLDAVIAATYADIIYSLAVLLTGLLAARLARRFAVT